jgi:hypothetical protein
VPSTAACIQVFLSCIASKKQEVPDAQKEVDELTAKLKKLESESGSPRHTTIGEVRKPALQQNKRPGPMLREPGL